MTDISFLSDEEVEKLAMPAEPAPQLTIYEIVEITGGKDINQLAQELAALRTQLAEAQKRETALRGTLKRVTDVLERSANALRGEPPELVLWSWHDLPERITALREALQDLFDEQNGPPLEKYAESWQTAHDKAARALSGEQANG